MEIVGWRAEPVTEVVLPRVLVVFRISSPDVGVRALTDIGKTDLSRLSFHFYLSTSLSFNTALDFINFMSIVSILLTSSSSSLPIYSPVSTIGLLNQNLSL